MPAKLVTRGRKENLGNVGTSHEGDGGEESQKGGEERG